MGCRCRSGGMVPNCSGTSFPAVGNIIPDRSGTVVPTDREFRFGSQLAGERRLVLRQKGSDEIEWYNPQKPDGGWCACQYDRHTGTGTAA